MGMPHYQVDRGASGGSESEWTGCGSRVVPARTESRPTEEDSLVRTLPPTISQPRQLLLVGGSSSVGKTTVAKSVAARLSWKCVETDRYLELERLQPLRGTVERRDRPAAEHCELLWETARFVDADPRSAHRHRPSPAREPSRRRGALASEAGARARSEGSRRRCVRHREERKKPPRNVVRTLPQFHRALLAGAKMTVAKNHPEFFGQKVIK